MKLFMQLCCVPVPYNLLHPTSPTTGATSTMVEIMQGETFVLSTDTPVHHQVHEIIQIVVQFEPSPAKIFPSFISRSLPTNLILNSLSCYLYSLIPLSICPIRYPQLTYRLSRNGDKNWISVQLNHHHNLFIYLFI